MNKNPQKFTSIDHDDIDPSNNNLGNLYFASMKWQRMNQKPRDQSGPMKNSRPIRMLDRANGNILGEFMEGVDWVKANTKYTRASTTARSS